MTGIAAGRQRRAYVLETLAAILAGAAAQGRRFVVAVDGSGCAEGFADDLAEALRLAGSVCTRLRDGAGSVVGAGPVAAAGPDVGVVPAAGGELRARGGAGAGVGADLAAGVVLADGERWRDRPLAGRWDVIIFLRTATARGHGDGERGADVVIDYHDPEWPIIRHVSPALDHPIERLYVTETQAFFGARAHTWNSKFGDDMPAYQAAVVESNVPPGATIVDIGCGTGRALPALASAAGDRGTVIGVDVTPEMLTIAARQCNGAHHLVMADARFLPLASASADVIFAAGLIQHLPDPGAGLAELARITRPGGKLIIFHPSGRAALAARHGRTIGPDEPLGQPQLEPLLAGAGWCLTRYDDPPHRFYALAQRI